MLFNILLLLLNDKNPDFLDSPFNWITFIVVLVIFGGAEISNYFDNKSHKGWYRYGVPCTQRRHLSGKLKRSDKGLTIQVSSQVSVKGDFEQMHLFLRSLKLYVKTCVQQFIKTYIGLFRLFSLVLFFRNIRFVRSGFFTDSLCSYLLFS